MKIQVKKFFDFYIFSFGFLSIQASSTAIDSHKLGHA